MSDSAEAELRTTVRETFAFIPRLKDKSENHIIVTKDELTVG
jgi:hypothetical protein